MLKSLLAAPLLALLLATPATAEEDTGPLAPSSQRKEISHRSLKLGDVRIDVAVYDAGPYFQAMHAGHTHHPGIPTHQILVHLDKGKDAPVLAVRGPSGKAVPVDFELTGQGAVADLELKPAGRYSFELRTRKGGPRDHWVLEIR